MTYFGAQAFARIATQNSPASALSEAGSLYGGQPPVALVVARRGATCLIRPLRTLT